VVDETWRVPGDKDQEVQPRGDGRFNDREIRQNHLHMDLDVAGQIHGGATSERAVHCRVRPGFVMYLE
jgi:hypothetical protein